MRFYVPLIGVVCGKVVKLHELHAQKARHGFKYCSVQASSYAGLTSGFFLR